jgi:hypothetical protein
VAGILHQMQQRTRQRPLQTPRLFRIDTSRASPKLVADKTIRIMTMIAIAAASSTLADLFALGSKSYTRTTTKALFQRAGHLEKLAFEPRFL